MRTDRGDGPGLGDQRRGISEVISVILLFGFVVAGAALVGVTWTSAQSSFEEQGQVESAQLAVQEFDSRLSDITSDGAPTRASFDLTDRDGDGESVSLESGDTLTVELHDGNTYRSDCTASVSLQEIVYDVDNETTLVHQAGGVFRTTGNHTTTATEPDIGFSEGSVDVAVTKFEGDVSNDEFDLSHDVGRSEELTAEKRADLFGNEACERPERVRLTVDTDDPEVWAAHLREEVPDGVTVTVSGTTVRAEINDSKLVREADDDRNGVVDFTSGTIAGTAVSAGGEAELYVDKGVDNEYTVRAQLLGTQYSQTNAEVTANEKNVTGRLWKNEDNESLDIVFLVDESGSMSGEMGQTRPPIKEFLNEFPQEQDHRASVVGFTTGPAEYQGLTNDRAALKGAVDKLNAGGGTSFAKPLTHAINQLKDGGDDRKKVIALMSDGKADDPPPGLIQKANNNGIKVYTIGFGSGADTSTLGSIAAETGGQYAHISEAQYLDSEYKVIVNDLGYKVYQGVVGTETVYNMTERPKIVRKPVVLEQKLEGGSYEPVVSGSDETEQAINYQEYVTTVPSLPDGERMKLRTRMYDCADTTQHEAASMSLPSNVSELVTHPDDGSPTIKSKYKYDAYEKHRCDTAGPSQAPSTVQVYTSGDDVPSSSSPVWETDFEEMVATHTADVDGDGDDEFDLQSNQVVVVYGDAHSSGELNSAVVLYTVGESTSLPAGFAVDLDIDVVEPED